MELGAPIFCSTSDDERESHVEFILYEYSGSLNSYCLGDYSDKISPTAIKDGYPRITAGEVVNLVMF